VVTAFAIRFIRVSCDESSAAVEQKESPTSAFQISFDRQTEVLLALSLSELKYSCGSPATFPSHPLHGKIFTRLNITCENIIEVPYYSATIGRPDLCCFCGMEGASIDQELKKKFKTVLPVCPTCSQINEIPCLRPYGKD